MICFDKKNVSPYIELFVARYHNTIFESVNMLLMYNGSRFKDVIKQ